MYLSLANVNVANVDAANANIANVDATKVNAANVNIADVDAANANTTNVNAAKPIANLSTTLLRSSSGYSNTTQNHRDLLSTGKLRLYTCLCHNEG